MSSAPARRRRQHPTLKLKDYLPYRLSVAANEVSRLVARAYEDRFGISIPQWRMIANLAEHGALTPQQIGRHAALDKVTVSRAAQGLIERGLLGRAENGQDGRSHILALSPEGMALYGAIAPIALAFEQDLIDDWAPEEVARLHEQLKRLQERASALAGQPS